MPKEQDRLLICTAFKLLERQYAYKQIEIVEKLKTLGYALAPASFNNIVKERNVGFSLLRKTAEGIKEIMRSELCMEWSSERKEFIVLENCKPTIIHTQEGELAPENPDFIFHKDGRLPIPDKVEFIKQAQNELVEFGVRLRTFTNYFISRSEQEFTFHIEKLLEKGCTVKLYSLDPQCNQALMYFQDRALAQESESKSLEEMSSVLTDLKRIAANFEGLPGKFEVYLYRHIPYNHFLIRDGDSLEGRMMVSHYIYGIKRADCPVFEFSKKQNRSLYRRYWQSYEALIKGAKKII